MVLKLLFWLYLAGLTLLCLIPPGGVDVGGSDKLAHGAAYFVLMSLAFGVFRGRYGLIWIAFSAITYGIVIECVQPVTGREFSLLDMAANAVGVAVMCGVIVLFSGPRGLLSPEGR
ncbi:MAG: VanZ family protein [Pseudomonadales bacterium]